MAINKKSTKSRILGLASSRRRLNSSKTIDEVTYYSLADVESVVAAVLSEVSSDPTVGITLEAADTGVILNCVTENGDEYAVDVDLESEDAAVAGEDSPAGDVNASRRRMNSGAQSFPYTAEEVGMEGEEEVIENDLGLTSGSVKKVMYGDEEFAKVWLNDGKTIIIADVSRNGHHKWVNANMSASRRRMNSSRRK